MQKEIFVDGKWRQGQGDLYAFTYPGDGSINAEGAVRRIQTRLSMVIIRWFYAAQICCHSTRAASR
jgi:hypothetical protein